MGEKLRLLSSERIKRSAETIELRYRALLALRAEVELAEQTLKETSDEKLGQTARLASWPSA